ncbi:type I-F CRISPR-associated protein Csy1 [Burkholderia sp. Leaf177]|uniref:type I-F CRISPR-associated protein Csy1 n=1 Tax=Burkholderia sp. Leaf177 TaxID=1736287 RepID=UPI0006F2432E|nr:type I-F CRISPR-associated protein Csy1 [Burkholderia sp. Leaf177]KQR74510.1 type I-F CRISPR-associated protein Csy1 [Burkholderia sp. Leaf177]
MPDSPVTQNHRGFRAAIDAFLHDRLQAKLDKLSAADLKRSQLIAEHQRGPWLESAAQRVKQIQAVTHSLKPVHPDARGTNLYVKPSELPRLDELGSHALGENFATDVVGNAAALDVCALLKLEVGGCSLLRALATNDPDALQALSTDPIEAETIRDALVSLTAKREDAASSHVRAKQLYWLVGDDANDDAQYHLLAPLYATSLAQAVYDEIQDARFGEKNKEARQARRDGIPHDAVYREYRDLAIQKKGGTKPQNISQLNSERRGNNYLLASLPPFWKSRRNPLPVNTKTIFERTFGSRLSVRATVRELKTFLQSDPPQNVHTRERRSGLVNRLVDELVIYGGELLHLPAGWTREQAFDDLADEEKLWLDPLRAELPDESAFASRWQFMDWPAQIGERFSKWLNGQLQDKLQDIGYAESREWRRILMNDDGSWMQQLRQTRERMDATRHIPVRKTHDELTASQEGL